MRHAARSLYLNYGTGDCAVLVCSRGADSARVLPPFIVKSSDTTVPPRLSALESVLADTNQVRALGLHHEHDPLFEHVAPLVEGWSLMGWSVNTRWRTFPPPAMP